jgi:hypothetical protein
VGAVFLKRARQRKFTQLVSHHVFRHKHRVEHLAVVNRERQADKLRRDRRAARPGLDRRFLIRRLRLLDFFQQATLNKLTFFNLTSHKIILSLSAIHCGEQQ